MALADDEAVAIRPQRVLRAVPHYAEVERGRNFDRREGAAGVAGVGVGGHLDDVPPNSFRDGLEFVDGDGLGAGQTGAPSGCIIQNGEGCRKNGRVRLYRNTATEKDRGTEERGAATYGNPFCWSLFLRSFFPCRIRA